MKHGKILILLFFLGCSGMEQSEQQKLRRLNAKGEFIHRNHDEYHYRIETPKHNVREPYPWEKGYVGQQPKITKEYFRCKGSGFNSPRSSKDLSKTYFDCGGCHTHSLPLYQDKEFIYPILIDLLNFIQEKTHAKVIITCGHRCPSHNTYADSSQPTSKHMIGAEVDFYVEGMQEQPEKIVALLQEYYQNSKYGSEYLEFERLYYHLDVSTPAWCNKEILIQVYQRNEGRDYDNQHNYPYICIQVRYDRENKERVIYSWPKAFKGFRRY